MLGNFKFTDSFLVLPKMKNVIVVNQSFKKHSIEISPSNDLLKIPETTFHLNEIKPKKAARTNLKKMKKFPIFLSKKTYFETFIPKFSKSQSLKKRHKFKKFDSEQLLRC